MSEPARIGDHLPDDPAKIVRAFASLPPPPERPDRGDPHPPDVPARYRTSLDALDPTRQTDQAARWLHAATTAHDHDRGLLLLGPVGTGKSAIAGAIARHLGAPVHAQFWPVPDLMRALKAEMDAPSDTMPILAKIARRRTLVLDDIGAERRTDWTVGILTDLIAARYDARQIIVATSNLTPGQLLEHLGERTLSRLHEMTELVVFEGTDRRKRRA